MVRTFRRSPNFRPRCHGRLTIRSWHRHPARPRQIDGPEYLGRLAVRHRLNAWLLDAGGHIGYDVRPSARRRGHATAMLGAALPRARTVGLDRVLVTCDDDNVASWKVIESCGGVFEDQRGRKLRYWLDTA